MAQGSLSIRVIRPSWSAGLVLLAAAAHAQAPADPAAPRSFWTFFAENALGLTILFILLSAILGAMIKYRTRDRVLKDFHGYRVVTELEDGRRIWGLMRVFPNGLEIFYEKAVQDDSGHEEISFVLHQAELAAVRALLRPVDRLTPAMEKRRKRELAQYIRPSVFRRSKRFSLIQLSILRDAIIQAFSLLIGQAKTIATPTSRVGSVLKTQDVQLTNIGKTVMGGINLLYDPVLESFFGQACVAEVKEKSDWRELTGFLKEYSSDWLLLLRCGWPLEMELRLDPGAEEAKAPQATIILRRDGGRLVLENGANHNVELGELAVGDARTALGGREILPGRSWTHEGPVDPQAAVTLRLVYIEPGDVIVPRSKSLVRHRIPQKDLSLLENLGIRRE